jgi:hypothetical protein
MNKQIKALKKQLCWQIESAQIIEVRPGLRLVRVMDYEGGISTFTVWKHLPVPPFVRRCIRLAYAQERAGSHDNISWEPKEKAPAALGNGFNLSMQLYRVAKNGGLVLLNDTGSCTYEGEEKVNLKVADLTANLKRFAVKTTRHGNRSWETLDYYR